MLRDWGAEKKYEHVLKGFNYRMEAIQGAILRVKLRYLDAWTEARRAHAAAYERALAYCGLVLPHERAGNRHVYHIYAVLSTERQNFITTLATRGVQAGVHYPTPIHLLPAYADLEYAPGDFPISEWVASEEVSLPMFPELTPEQVAEVCATIREREHAYQC